MKELARISIDGDQRLVEQLESMWNASNIQDIRYGAIALHREEPAYARLRELVAQFADQGTINWSEWVEIQYSTEELRSFELLELIIVGRAGEGGNSNAHVYDADVVCAGCGRTEYRQVRSLVLDLSLVEPDEFETGYFQHDLCKTDFDDEVVVSSKVKQLLESREIPGIRLRAIAPALAGRTAATLSGPYYQLVIEQTIGALAEITQIERHDRCELCGQFRGIHRRWPGQRESELVLPRASYSGQPIARTIERFGTAPNFGSALIINQDVYRLLAENRVTGFWVQPVHLVSQPAHAVSMTPSSAITS